MAKFSYGSSGPAITVTTTSIQVGANTLYMGQTKPGTCVKGDICADSNGKLYVASATDTWTVAGSQI